MGIFPGSQTSLHIASSGAAYCQDSWGTIRRFKRSAAFHLYSVLPESEIHASPSPEPGHLKYFSGQKLTETVQSCPLFNTKKSLKLRSWKLLGEAAHASVSMYLTVHTMPGSQPIASVGCCTPCGSAFGDLDYKAAINSITKVTQSISTI